jgi:putative transposase
VAICTEERECLFGTILRGAMVANGLGQMVEAFWHALPKRYPGIELDGFVLMPNHIHGVIALPSGSSRAAGQASACQTGAPIASAKRVQASNTFEWARRRRMLLPKITGYFKMNTAKRANLIRCRPGLPLWQRNYRKHVIRDELDLQRIRTYVAGSPGQWEADQLYPNNPPRR